MTGQQRKRNYDLGEGKDTVQGRLMKKRREEKKNETIEGWERDVSQSGQANPIQSVDCLCRPAATFSGYVQK
jgi:hypothetical protein